MTTVRITETYDLSTRINKIGMIGIHTPSTGTIKALYPGLWDAHKFVRLKKCDVTLACASMLPADPLQVGTTAGSIAPQDMFNPILYRAVTNESFDMIMGRVFGMQSAPTNATGHNTAVVPEAFGTITNSAEIYYSLLSERGWRKSMPQTGLSMRGLVPLVYPVLNTFGNVVTPSGTSALTGNVPFVADDGNISSTGYRNCFFRGRPQKMPRIPTKLSNPTVNPSAPIDSSVPNSFVSCLIMPPSKLHQLYYRLRVSWTISFEGVRSVNEYGSVADIMNNADQVYLEYMPSSKQGDMEKDENMVATNDMDMDMIMQSGM